MGFPCGSAGKESASNAGDLGLILGKVPWRRERLPTPVFWPGEFHGLYSPWGHKELGVLEHTACFLYSHVFSHIIIYLFKYLAVYLKSYCIFLCVSFQNG